jgi:hypothetical protein
VTRWSWGYLHTAPPERVRRVLYLASLERGFLDPVLDRVLVAPFMRLAHQLTRLDRWLCAGIAPMGQPSTAGAGEDQDE